MWADLAAGGEVGGGFGVRRREDKGHGRQWASEWSSQQGHFLGMTIDGGDEGGQRLPRARVGSTKG